MTTLRLILGADRTLEADAAALPAILGLCRSLGIPSHHNPADTTLYIAVPATGRSLAVEADREGPEQYRSVATQTAAALSGRLAAVGARIAQTPADAPELLLRISPGALPNWGVAAGYGWQDWREQRNLCASLCEALAAACGMPDLGARMSLAGGRQGGVPVIDVAIGRPAPGTADPLLDPAFPAKAADALYRGLCHAWADPALAEVCAALPTALSTPPAVEPAPPEAPESPEVPELPQADTIPEAPTIPEACHCETDPEFEPGIEVERIILDPVTITSYQPERPAPAPAPPIPLAAAPPLEAPPIKEPPAKEAPAAPGHSSLVSTFFAPAPPPRRKPRTKTLITQQSAALVHIQFKMQKNHPR